MVKKKNIRFFLGTGLIILGISIITIIKLVKYIF